MNTRYTVQKKLTRPGPAGWKPVKGAAVLKQFLPICLVSLILLFCPAAAEAGPQPPVMAEPAGLAGWWAAAQANIHQSEYAISRQEPADLPAAYQAPNRAHNLRAHFSRAGLRLTPRVFEGDTPPWELSLALSGYGRAGEIRPVGEPAGLYAAGNRIEYRYQTAAGEWYRNDRRGLEHGVILQAPPGPVSEKGAEIVFSLALGGSLSPYPAGNGLEFIAPGQGRVLSYGEPAACDATGRRLPARLELVPAGHEIRLVLNTAQAAYPVTVRLLAMAPDWSFESNQAKTVFGWSVGTAGDVNNDGYDDIIVGANEFDNGQTDEGAAFVFYGSAGGPSLAPDWSAEGNQASAEFGHSVGTAGDVNGDGYDDVIIGAEKYDGGNTDEGRAFVYYGSAAGLAGSPAWTADSNQTNARFGHSVGTAGDVNNDGYSDVIVGAFYYDNGESDEGRAYVFHGSAAGLATSANWMAEGDLQNAWYGWSVGTAGDVNNDGYSDVLVGAEFYTNGQSGEGRVFVYHGSAGGLAPSANWTAEADQAWNHFGFSAGTAGDVNGDGYDDVIIGGDGYTNSQTEEGRAVVYHGSAAGLGATSAWTVEGNQTYAYLGWSVGTAGDVNNDGYSDVFVATPYYDNNEHNEGIVFVYYGSAAGLAGSPAWTAESDVADANLGYSVGAAGDVNDDGYDDVIAGAPYYDHDQNNEGIVFVYYGREGDVTYHIYVPVVLK